MSKIPHCCLHQEFGPSLSPDVIGRPLRPMKDHRLGKPLPTNYLILRKLIKKRYQISLLVHEILRIYLQFFGRFLRTTHPYAMVYYTIQLACVKLIARVHSEPGSNSYSSRPFMFTLKKESLQLQVPLQLPCYDFTPITFLTLEKNPTTTQIKRRKVWSFVFWLCVRCEFLLLQGMKIFRV